MVHELKIDNVYITSIIDGSKRFDVRLDKKFQVGDYILFRSCNVLNNQEEGVAFVKIVYLFAGAGLESEYVAFGFDLLWHS